MTHAPSLFEDQPLSPEPEIGSPEISLRTEQMKNPFEPLSDHAEALAARAETELAALAEKRKSPNKSERDAVAGIRGFQDGRSGSPRVNPFKLKVKDGFNCRNFDLPEQVEADRIMTDSIKLRGVLESIEVEIGEDGITLLVVDGESRLRNTIRAINEGAPIESVPVKVAPAGLDEAELVARQLVHNNQRRNFSPLEIATNVKKLLGYGWDGPKIERETGVSIARQKDALETAALPVEAKKLITSGQVSASLAREKVRGASTKAEGVQQLREAAKVAKAQNRTRILPRDMGSVSDRTYLAGAFREAETSRDAEGRTSVTFEGGVFEEIKRRLGL